MVTSPARRAWRQPFHSLKGALLNHLACSIIRCGGLLAIACAASTAGAAQPAPLASAASSSADAVYRRERVDCAKETAPQGRATCLKEAGAAHAEAQRKLLGNGEDARALAANAELRCKRVATADRDACLRMARGEGTVSGSVEGGGLMKTLTMPVPSPMSAASR